MTGKPLPTEGELLFDYSAVISEIQAFHRVAAEYLEQDGLAALQTMSSTLERFSQATTTSVLTWEISSDLPIRTMPSIGEFQPQQRKGRHIYGLVTFIWGIQNFSPKPKKKNISYPFFRLTGKASTSVELREVKNDRQGEETIARWNFDVGNAHSPGCHFHVQIPEGDGPRHCPIDVPRWPSLLYLPTDAVAFVLGELFQDRWAKHVGRSGGTPWHSQQQKRLARTLNWMVSVVNEANGSSWALLKASKPPANLLTHNGR